jgi:predicted amidohydrolase YtcJ
MIYKNTESLAEMDVLLYNGVVRTMNDENETAQAIGARDGKIAFVGTNDEAAKYRAVRRIDLNGKTVFPGFNDSHIHCLTYAWYENCVKLHGARSFADIVSFTQEYREGRAHVTDKWIVGRGWNEYNFEEQKAFTKDLLDEIAPDTPIAFLRTCGHACVVNSKALEQILALEKTRELHNDINQETGMLREGAARLFFDAIPPFRAEDLTGLIKYAADRLNACGITSIHSDDLKSLPVASPYETIHAFKSMIAEGELTVRVCCLNSYDSPEQLNLYIKDGYQTGRGDEMFRIGPVKIITDGSLGGKTAALKDAYAGAPGDFGTLHYDLAQLTNFVNTCRENGLDVTIHAIGDKAMENAALAIKASNERFGAGRRHGVLHSQVTEHETLTEMGRQSVQAFIQPVFVGSDMDTAEKLLNYPEKKKLYAWKSMLDAGMNVAGSACAPVEPFNVLENIQYAVTREKLQGGPAGGWIPSEKLSVEEAVRLFTTNGAYASYEEDIKGTLEPGKLADMAILRRDLFEVDPHKFKDIHMDCTILGGKIVYNRAGL